jgi:hypothetical protein
MDPTSVPNKAGKEIHKLRCLVFRNWGGYTRLVPLQMSQQTSLG